MSSSMSNSKVLICFSLSLSRQDSNFSALESELCSLLACWATSLDNVNGVICPHMKYLNKVNPIRWLGDREAEVNTLLAEFLFYEVPITKGKLISTKLYHETVKKLNIDFLGMKRNCSQRKLHLEGWTSQHCLFKAVALQTWLTSSQHND